MRIKTQMNGKGLFKAINKASIMACFIDKAKALELDMISQEN